LVHNGLKEGSRVLLINLDSNACSTKLVAEIDIRYVSIGGGNMLQYILLAVNYATYVGGS
jgi:hypothetical protein